jgi:hypothetical protein
MKASTGTKREMQVKLERRRSRMMRGGSECGSYIITVKIVDLEQGCARREFRQGKELKKTIPRCAKLLAELYERGAGSEGEAGSEGG